MFASYKLTPPPCCIAYRTAQARALPASGPLRWTPCFLVYSRLVADDIENRSKRATTSNVLTTLLLSPNSLFSPFIAMSDPLASSSTNTSAEKAAVDSASYPPSSSANLTGDAPEKLSDSPRLVHTQDPTEFKEEDGRQRPSRRGTRDTDVSLNVPLKRRLTDLLIKEGAPFKHEPTFKESAIAIVKASWLNVLLVFVPVSRFVSLHLKSLRWNGTVR